jgi:hypothetical protein
MRGQGWGAGPCGHRESQQHCPCSHKRCNAAMHPQGFDPVRTPKPDSSDEEAPSLDENSKAPLGGVGTSSDTGTEKFEGQGQGSRKDPGARS